MKEINKSKSKTKRPRKVVTQKFPWSASETTLHYELQKTSGTFCGLFSFISFKITDEVTRFGENPCTTFFDCVLLCDLPYYNTLKGSAQKGTVLRRIEFRQHCSLLLYAAQENSIFEECESVCFTFDWKGRTFSELYGCRGLGFKGAPAVLSENAWKLSLKCTEPQHLEASGGNEVCSFVIHFPSFEFEFESPEQRQTTPSLYFYTDNNHLKK
jgi:hypothetical protein